MPPGPSIAFITGVMVRSCFCWASSTDWRILAILSPLSSTRLSPGDRRLLERKPTLPPFVVRDRVGIGLEVARVAGEQIAALSGFRIHEEGQELIL